jgi:hypothetical protein
MTKTAEALDAWLKARRNLEAATPWTAEWVRARMLATDCRTTYEALASEEGTETTARANIQRDRAGIWR